MDLSEVHEEGISGKGINVAVIDFYDIRFQEGFQTSHKAYNSWNIENKLTKKTKKELELTKIECKTDHALRTTSIIAGRKFDNGYNQIDNTSIRYPGGIVPDAKVTLFLCDKTIKSIYETLKKVRDYPCQFDVLSMSVGAKQYKFYSVIQEIRMKHPTIIVAAAGNNGKWNGVMYPAKLPDVISVGSLNPFSFEVSPYSPEDHVNVYYCGDVVCPMADPNKSLREKTKKTNLLSFASGTSFAAPGVAGIVCLFRDIYKKALKSNILEGEPFDITDKKGMLEVLKNFSEFTDSMDRVDFIKQWKIMYIGKHCNV